MLLGSAAWEMCCSDVYQSKWFSSCWPTTQHSHNVFCNVFSIISYIHLSFDGFIIGYCWREKMPVLQFSPRNILCVSSSQFVVVGGSWNRMGGFAEFIAQEIGHPHVKREELSISKPGSDRFAFYKIGPVLSISVSSARVDCRVEHIAKISFLSYCCHK